MMVMVAFFLATGIIGALILNEDHHSTFGLILITVSIVALTALTIFHATGGF